MTVSPSRGAVLCETGERRTHRERKALFRLCALKSSPPRGDRKANANRQDDADHQSAHPQAAHYAACEEEGAGAATKPAEARRVYPGLHHDSEEAELGLAQGREGAAHERLRGDRLYPWRGPQSAGALGGDDPRRPRQGLAWGALPHPARCARYPRREESEAKALQIRSKEAEVIRPLCADPGGAKRDPRNRRGKTWPGRP